MRAEQKEILYVFEYREKGEKKSIEFKIDFVSIDIIDAVEFCINESQKIQEMSDKMGSNFVQMEKLKSDKPDGYEEQINKLKEEIKEIGKTVSKIDKNEMINRQLTAVIQLLEDNGIKDEKILSVSFWKKNVALNDIIKFLIAVIYKDVDLKKNNADTVTHYDRLFWALKKVYPDLTEDKFWKDFDIPKLNNAIALAQFPKEIENFIFEKKRQPLEMYEKGK